MSREIFPNLRKRYRARQRATSIFLSCEMKIQRNSIYPKKKRSLETNGSYDSCEQTRHQEPRNQCLAIGVNEIASNYQLNSPRKDRFNHFSRPPFVTFISPDASFQSPYSLFVRTLRERKRERKKIGKVRFRANLSKDIVSKKNEYVLTYNV